MEEIDIEDESSDRKYFTLVPNCILNHSTHTDQALYLQMKRLAGESGKCFATQKTLMKKLGVKRKTLLKSLQYLLDKKWIKFIGMTGGKTRPIKTYAIVDIWRLNIEEYEKIVVPKTPFHKKDSSPKDTTIVVPKTPFSIKEELYKKNQLCKPEGLQVNEVIKLFEEVNPSYQRLFPNKTQRSAAARLLKKWSLEQIRAVVGILPKLNADQYAKGKSITPLQLEANLGYIKAYIDQHNSKKIKSV
jgi:hypothetical protein